MTGPARSRRATVSSGHPKVVSSVVHGRAGATTLARPLVCWLEPAIRAEPVPDLKAEPISVAGRAPTLRAASVQAGRRRKKARRAACRSRWGRKVEDGAF